MRSEAVSRLAKLVAHAVGSDGELGGPIQGHDWAVEMARFQQCFELQLGDLRSSLVKETCNAIVAIASSLGACYIPTVLSILPRLGANCYVTVKVTHPNNRN